MPSTPSRYTSLRSQATHLRHRVQMEDPPRHPRFDPPSNVVAPALAELIVRLRTSVGTYGSRDVSGMPSPEREVFEYGLAQRQRVLSTTAVLVLGQWGLYRSVIKPRIPSQPMRALYVTGCTVGTLSLLQNRARAASEEMFARVITLPTTSPLANEARIILAELEGPMGAHFSDVCQERSFTPDLHSAVKADDTNVSVHPQLRLHPRLEGSQRRARRGLKNLGTGNGKKDDDDADDDTDNPHVLLRRRMDERQRQAESRVPLPPIFGNNNNDERRESSTAKSMDIEWREAEPTPMEPMDDWSNDIADDMNSNNNSNRQWSSAGFDFQSAARRDTYPEQGDSGEENDSDQLSLTPSQRRAHERRERRRIARERAFSGETKTDNNYQSW